MNQQTLGGRLRFARKTKGLTMEYISERADISQTQISTIEREKADPTSKTIINIAKALDISVLWLMTGIGSMDATTDQCPTQYQVVKSRCQELEEELQQVQSELKITHQMIDRYGFGNLGSRGKDKVTEESPQEIAA